MLVNELEMPVYDPSVVLVLPVTDTHEVVSHDVETEPTVNDKGMSSTAVPAGAPPVPAPLVTSWMVHGLHRTFAGTVNVEVPAPRLFGATIPTGVPV